MIDLTPTEDQLSFQRTAREFLADRVIPFRAEWDRRESVDVGIVKELGEMGFLGMTVPERLGGTECDYQTYAMAMEELGWADSAVRGIVSVSLGLVTKSILAYGSVAQQEEWIPQLADGSILGCFGLTEPGTGSDAGSLIARAERHGSDYVISGTKTFITNGTWAEVCLMFARTGMPGPRGVSAFLVPLNTPGVTRHEVKGKLGLRGQATAELTFDSVRVPATALLGEEGHGFAVAMSALDRGRVSIAASCVGIIRACVEQAVEYSQQRQQFGRPLASFQLVQQLIAGMAVDAEAARGLVRLATDLMSRGESFGTQASMAKYFASEAAVRASNDAIQVYGGYGFVDEFPVQKLMRDARVMTLYEGTSQIQQLLIGRALTGVNAFI
ncbi:acyl-CoA dehydrogenase family protein [Marmoricola sp. RAF53]|uniref:acyl-CoA dehydrogenase family protein n=1 Tax=Marmoricola sp. RAF53 TaxID=3233059 RepID=UPI003F980371